MSARKIAPVKNNSDKYNTYQNQIKRYNLAVKHEFHFEAMLICYAMMEDRLNSWLYYLGCRKTDKSFKFDVSASKDKLKPLVERYLPKESNNLGITSITGKRKIIKATLLWAKDGYPEAESDKYYSAIWAAYQDIDIDEALVYFAKCEDWCAYRNEIIHALMNKNTDSLNSELAARVTEGMEIARYFDSLVKRVKKGKSIRKSINLK